MEDAVINSRAFMSPLDTFGSMKDGASSRSSVWHWHGYKAHTIHCIFEAIKEGTWDVSTPDGITKWTHQAFGQPTDTGPKPPQAPKCKVIGGSFKFG